MKSLNAVVRWKNSLVLIEFGNQDLPISAFASNVEHNFASPVSRCIPSGAVSGTIPRRHCLHIPIPYPNVKCDVFLPNNQNQWTKDDRSVWAGSVTTMAGTQSVSCFLYFLACGSSWFGMELIGGLSVFLSFIRHVTFLIDPRRPSNLLSNYFSTDIGLSDWEYARLVSSVPLSKLYSNFVWMVNCNVLIIAIVPALWHHIVISVHGVYVFVWHSLSYFAGSISTLKVYWCVHVRCR